MITEVPEFCGAEHLLASRAKDDRARGLSTRRLVQGIRVEVWRGAQQQSESATSAGGLLNITIKSLGAIAKAGSTRVEGVIEYAETPKHRGLNLMQGPGYDQESTPGSAPVRQWSSLYRHDDRKRDHTRDQAGVKHAGVRTMSNDLDLSAGGVIDGTETIDEVGQRVFERIVEVASGLQAKAEEHKHREFQFWAEQTVSL